MSAAAAAAGGAAAAAAGGGSAAAAAASGDGAASAAASASVVIAAPTEPKKPKKKPKFTKQMSVAALLQRAIITFCARDLDNKDVPIIGKSDPFVEIVRKDTGIVVGRTHVLRSQKNASWEPMKVDIKAAGGYDNPLSVRVVDYDKDSRHDLIGSFDTTLKELKTQLDWPFNLINEKKKGRLFYKDSGVFHVTEYKEEEIIDPFCWAIRMRARKIPKASITTKADPFFVIWRAPVAMGSSLQKKGHRTRTDDMTFVCKSPIVKKDKNPAWEEVYIDVDACGGYDDTIFIQVWAFDKSGKHDYVGEVICSLRQLLMEGFCFPIINPRKMGGMTYNNSGEIFIEEAVPVADKVKCIYPNLGYINFHCHAKRLDKKDFFGKSDPFFQVLNHKNERVLRSGVVYKTLNPNWKRQFQLNAEEVGGADKRFTIELWDWDRGEKNDYIGSFTTTLRELYFWQNNPEFRVYNAKKDGMFYGNSGIFIFDDVTFVYEKPPKKEVVEEEEDAEKKDDVRSSMVVQMTIQQ